MKSKKFFRFIGLSFLLLSLLLSFSSGTFAAPDEELVNTFLQNTYATSMIFEGVSQNWNCSFIVKQAIAKNSMGIENVPKVTVIITPRFTWERGPIWAFNVKIHTSNGAIVGTYGLMSGQSISLNTNAPVPEPSETILVEISGGPNGDELIKLSNIVPRHFGMVTPEEALRTTLDVFYKTYGEYPTKNYTFDIVFYDKIYWLVSIDDNDGIGGLSHLLINAYTGVASEIKEDE